MDTLSNQPLDHSTLFATRSSCAAASPPVCIALALLSRLLFAAAAGMALIKFGHESIVKEEGQRIVKGEGARLPGASRGQQKSIISS